MKFAKIVFEAKNPKEFQNGLKKIILSDNKAKQLQQAFRKDDDKMVDLIDYLMGKHEKEIEKLMDEHNIGYDEAVDIIMKLS